MKKGIIIILGLILTTVGLAQQPNKLRIKESDAIVYIREEEKLARDVYDSMYAKWGGNPFGNIRKSEQVHMDKMKLLIDVYQLKDPVISNNDIPGTFANTSLQGYYNELIAAGSNSFTEALKVGAKIEELDIADLNKRIEITHQKDIIDTYQELKKASENHLRAFVRRLKMQGLEYEPVILSNQLFEKIVLKSNM